MKCIVKLIWDVESRTWYTETEDIPGLILSGSTYDALMERVRFATPEMLELNCDYTGPVQLIFEAERIETVSA